MSSNIPLELALTGVSETASLPGVDVSVVVPIYNEVESIPDLIAEIVAALDGYQDGFEIICVDDGSQDGSFALLEQLRADEPRLNLLELRRNFGQTAAMQAGMDVARGRVIALMDADLQNDPADIPAMVEELDSGFDMVAGWRKERKDTFINRRLPSIIANRLISWMTGVSLHDYGCTLKVLRAELAAEIELYGEMHRFIPAIAHQVGARISERAVGHRARKYGSTKYGIGRTTRVLLDLLVVRFQQTHLTRPMQLFGSLGALVSSAGLGICGYLTYEKFVHQVALSQRPLLTLGVLLILVGGQLLSFGLMADVLSRTYHEARGKKAYHVRKQLQTTFAGEQWSPECR